MVSLDIIILSLLLLSLCVTHIAKADDHAASCPCRIFVKEGLHIADCRRYPVEQKPKLTIIPDCVPNNTHELDFRGNDLWYTPGQFQRFSDLVYLDLCFNINFAVHNDSFRSLYLLETLNLCNTDLTYMTGQMFVDQSRLLDLCLGFGTYEVFNVNADIFTHLGNLRALKFGILQRLYVQANAFNGLSMLKSLELGKNRIITLNESSFGGLTSLKRLSLTNPVLTITLPEQVFEPLTSLVELMVQGTCGSDFPDFDCSTIDTRLQYLPSLKKLYIDNVLVSKIGSGFLSLTNLEELYLTKSLRPQRCEVDYLYLLSFKHLHKSKLTKLSLDHCSTKMVMPETFLAIKSLSFLQLKITTEYTETILSFFANSLSHTNIHTIKLSVTGTSVDNCIPVIAGLRDTNLTSLELTNTQYQSVDTDFIVHLPKSLVNLSLTQNRLAYFTVEALSYLQNLHTLDLSKQLEDDKTNSFLSSMNFDRKIRPNNSSEAIVSQRFTATLKKCFGLPYQLKHLYLNKSRLLPEFMSAFCENNNSLKVLDVSFQRDTSPFESRSFWNVLKHLMQLEALNLEGNKIDIIPRDAFSGLHKLRVISLVDNKLTELSFYVRDLVSLETLDVSFNIIGYATESFTSQIEDVAWISNLTIGLHHNSLKCGCTEQGFVAWLLYSKLITNKGDINCTFENGTGVSLERLSRIHLLLDSQCIKAEVIAGCIVVFFSQLVVLGLLAYILHNCQKLRYLVLFGRRTLNPYHPIEDHEIEMEYDVYISFEGESYVRPGVTLRDFMYRKILPGLERRHVKAMIREELDPGRNLYEVITNTVRRSKKVLVFLSRDYCSDMWNIFEFNQAVMEGIYTNRQIAIPVLFDNIGPGDVKEEIYAFLSMEPVHRYSSRLSDREFISFLCERINDTRKFG